MSNLSIFAETWDAEYHSMLIFISTLFFKISNLKSIFEQIWTEKVETFRFA